MSIRMCAIALGLTFAPSIASACSMRFGIGPTLGSSEVLLLGRATADTVYAGSGGRRWNVAAGQHAAPYVPPIYGQLLQVDSARGPGARAGRRVVLVPWDYASDCTPLPWGNSARWMRPGTSGLYVGTLRDSAYWSNGLPTYDVFTPQFYPYNSVVGGAGSIGAADTMKLSAEQMFSAAAHFPRDGDTTGLKNLLSWAQANSTQAKREPLSSTLRDAVRVIRAMRIAALDLPLRGTYRIVATVGADSVVFFGRTDLAVMRFEDRRALEAPLQIGALTQLPTVERYELLLRLEANTGDIRHDSPQSMIRLPVRGTTMNAATTWEGEVQADLAGLVFTRSPFASLANPVSPYLKATFVLDAAGQASLEHTSRVPDGRVFTMRGARISLASGR
jgi:hypothetical protein